MEVEDDVQDDVLDCCEDFDEAFNMCSGCEEHPIASIVRPCGHMLCEYCSQTIIIVITVASILLARTPFKFFGCSIGLIMKPFEFLFR